MKWKFEGLTVPQKSLRSFAIISAACVAAYWKFILSLLCENVHFGLTYTLEILKYRQIIQVSTVIGPIDVNQIVVASLTADVCIENELGIKSRIIQRPASSIKHCWQVFVEVGICESGKVCCYGGIFEVTHAGANEVHVHVWTGCSAHGSRQEAENGKAREK